MKFVLHWFAGTLAIAIAAYFVPGVHVSILGAVIAALILGALNFFLKPILSILTLPINILTLGLFSLITNAVLVLLASYIVQKFVFANLEFVIADFKSALIFAVVLSLMNFILRAVHLE